MSKHDYHRKPSNQKLSKLCIRCNRTDILDKARFTTNYVLTKKMGGDICLECYPTVLENHTQNKTHKRNAFGKPNHK